ncbi:MAG: hypothetical protein ACR2FS_14155 [Phormidesmis sp.]
MPKSIKVLLVFLLVVFGVLPAAVAIRNSLKPSTGTVAATPAEAPLPAEAAAPVEAAPVAAVAPVEAVAPVAAAAPVAPIPTTPTNDQAFAEYKAALETISGMSSFVSDIRPGLIDGMVELEVTVNFQEESKPAREDFAVSLWEAWVAASDLEDVDDARIRLVNRQGKQVGGSRMIGGSVIYVDD